MQNPNDELEKLFSERFVDYDAPVPDDAFDAIQNRLNSPRPNNKRWFMLAAALLLLISTCSYLKYSSASFLNKGNDVEKKSLANTNETQHQNDISDNLKNTQIVDNQYIINKKENTKTTSSKKDETSLEKNRAFDVEKNQKNASIDTKTPVLNVSESVLKTKNANNDKVNNINDNNVGNFVDNSNNQPKTSTTIEENKNTNTLENVLNTLNPALIEANNSINDHEKTQPLENIQKLFPNPMVWMNGPSQITLPTVAEAIPKKPRTHIPITFDYSAAALWTSYGIANNTKDHILINQVVVPKVTSAQRLGLRVGLGLNVQLTPNLTFQQQLSAQLSQLSMQYVSTEADYSLLKTSKVGQGIVVQPSLKTTNITQEQTQFVATVQSGLRYQLPRHVAISAAAGYQYNQGFKAGRWISSYGADYGFKTKTCTYHIGPFAEIPLSRNVFSFQDALYFNPTYVGVQLRIGK